MSATAAREDVLLSVENLTKSYMTSHGRIDAISNANVVVRRSEFLCVIGPSGCGKSTLLYLISGISLPTSGTILLEGSRMAGPSPKVGMVFQKYSAFPWMTVEQNVSYGPRMCGQPKDKIAKTTAYYINLVGLAGYEHLYPKELSGGMSKRVDIARAYANNPSVLLMDEPFGALDDLTKKQMQIELLKIWGNENKTVVFVTHDLEEAAFLADRIVVFQRKPNTVRTVREVPFARPREPELRLTPEFTEFKRNLSEVMGHDAGENF